MGGYDGAGVDGYVVGLGVVFEDFVVDWGYAATVSGCLDHFQAFFLSISVSMFC